MIKKQFVDELNKTFIIAYFQHALKMVLRACWLGGAVYLLFWGTNHFLGWFTNSVIWVLVALGLGIVILLLLLHRRKIDSKFVWKLDRKFGVHEQIYTAYEDFNTKDTQSDDDISIELYKDATNKLPEIRKLIVDAGWGLRGDIEATIIVLILLFIVYVNSVGAIDRLSGNPEINVLPALGSDPRVDEVLPYLGNQESASRNPDLSPLGQNASSELIESNDLGNLASDYFVIVNIMGQLGGKLSAESSLYQLGDSLETHDFNQAALAFEDLAVNIEKISTETKILMANSFLDTAVELNANDLQWVSQPFQASVDALYGNSSVLMSEKLGDLADLMLEIQKLNKQGGNYQSNNEQYYRDVIELEGGIITSDTITVPMVGEVEGVGVEGEPVQFEAIQTIKPSSEDWQINTFSLDDADVVSSYFSPE